MVMTGSDAKTGRPVCLKVTGDGTRFDAELRCRSVLSPDFVVEFFDSLSDQLGNHTMVHAHHQISAWRSCQLS